MSEQFLDGPNVVSRGKQSRGEAVAERVETDGLGGSRLAGSPTNALLQNRVGGAKSQAG
jgi:hypothetical protein